MPVYDFDQTKGMLLENVRIKTDVIKASVMNSQYVYHRGLTSHASMAALVNQTVVATLTTTYVDNIYRVWLDPLNFTNVTVVASHVVLFADGYKGTVNGPVLWDLAVGDMDLRRSNFQLRWNAPLFRW